jgi:NADPH:quinone reductase-like Zn-dependent oxidoreductase
MKAAQYPSYGDSSVIEINENAPTPTLKDGQVMVEVHAAALNPFDYKVRMGYMKEMIPLTFPVTIGGDFSGVVTEIAPGVTEFSVGDEVYGQAVVVNGGSGAIAEFAAANTKNTAKKPTSVDFSEAASLVLVGVSSIQALEDSMKLSSGQKILIHGGAGGIGSIAIQLAKHLGAYVTTTVSTGDEELVKSLGADEVIDYKTEKFEEKISDYDAVFDTIGGDTLERSFGVLKKGGVLVSMTGQVDQAKASEHEITGVGQFTDTNTIRLKRLAELVDSGVIRPQIDKSFTLDETAAAYTHLETSHPKGKVVVTVRA